MLREPARPRGGARRRAAFTIAQDEPLWLPAWLDHYARSFASGDLYVLDHGGTAHVAGRANVVPVHRAAAFDHHWLKTVVEAFQRFLLRSYEAVLFAEVDEFLVVDPRRYADLGAYIDELDRPASRASGWNVVQQADEGPLDFDAPWLAQRAWWHASLDYSKRSISRVPSLWADGFHAELGLGDQPPDPDLHLVHAHRIDLETCRARHRATAGRDWSAADVATGAGAQNRVTGAGFEEWFRAGPDLDAPRERIPQHLRGTL